MSTQTVLITGALTGIGPAAAIQLAKARNNVVVSDRREDTGQALTDELRSYGAEAEFMRADVRNEDDVRHLVDQTVSRFGRIDSAINNAGTEGKLPRSSRLTVARPLAEAVVEEIHKMGSRADAVADAADLAAADSPHKLTTEIRAIVGERLTIQNIVKDVVHRHIEDAEDGATLRAPCLLGMSSSLQSLFQQHLGRLKSSCAQDLIQDLTISTNFVS